MISSSLAALLFNKYTIGIFSGLIGLLWAYLKGKSNANRQNELEKLEAERALNSRIRAAEAKNQFLEKKGEKRNEAINNADTIDDLISLWNSQQSDKSSDGSSDKDS